MKISMAKEISMLQRNEKDKEVHFYFIKCDSPRISFTED